MFIVTLFIQICIANLVPCRPMSLDEKEIRSDKGQG